MDNHFENNIEEINQIITRSKKDKSITIFRIQKSKRLTISQLNNEIEDCNIDTLEGVNMHLLSNDGYLIYGASDRMHLPDVITRLYQSLDNLLKANKGHKVRNNIVIQGLPNENISRIEYLDIAEWDIEYVKNILAQIYSDVPTALKDKLNLKFRLEGNHSLWLIANSQDGKAEFDDFSMIITWDISLKTNSSRNMSLSRLILASDIRSKKVNTNEIVAEIISYSKLLNTELANSSVSKIIPEAVLLDSELANVCFYNLLKSNSVSAISKEYEINDESTIELINEQICKYGSTLSEKIKISSKDSIITNTSFFDYNDQNDKSTMRVSRQYSFYDQVVPHFRNIILKSKKKEDVEISLDMDNISESLKEIKKKLGITKLLFLAGIKDNYLNENCHSSSLSPVVSIFSDEDKTSLVNIHHMVMPNMSDSEIKFYGVPSKTVFRFGTSELPFTVAAGNLCLVKSTKEINVA